MGRASDRGGEGGEALRSVCAMPPKKDNEDLNAPMNAPSLKDPGSDDEAGAPDPAVAADPAGFKSIGKPRYKMTYRPLLVFLVFMMLSVSVSEAKWLVPKSGFWDYVLGEFVGGNIIAHCLVTCFFMSVFRVCDILVFKFFDNDRTIKLYLFFIHICIIILFGEYSESEKKTPFYISYAAYLLTYL